MSDSNFSGSHSGSGILLIFKLKSFRPEAISRRHAMIDSKAMKEEEEMERELAVCWCWCWC